MAAEGPPQIPRRLEVLTAWSWRLLVIGAAVLALVLLLARLRLVVLPVVVALLLSTVLIPLRRGLTDRRVPRPLAMLLTVVVFFGVAGAISQLIVPPLVNEFSDLDATLGEAADDVEQWFVTGPLGLDADRVADARESVEEAAGDAVSSEGAILGSVLIAGEVVAGAILALVIAFFVVKDAERIQRGALEWVPERYRPRTRAAGRAAWRALSGYLLAAAVLGLIEALVIGTTLAVVGADLVVPLATLTFLAAFFPFVGAVVAGLLAVVVTFVTSGFTAAVIVAVVALLVQQFDNDLLGPVIYGRALSLHPLVVILALAVGGTLGGLTGAFLAVPFTAVAVRTIAVVQQVDPVTGEVPEVPS